MNTSEFRPVRTLPQKPRYGTRDDLAREMYERGIKYRADQPELELFNIALERGLIDVEGKVDPEARIVADAAIPGKGLSQTAQRLPEGSVVLRGDDVVFREALRRYARAADEELTAADIVELINAEAEAIENAEGIEAAEREQAEYLGWLEGFAKEPVLAKAKESGVRVNANMKVRTMFARFREGASRRDAPTG